MYFVLDENNNKVEALDKEGVLAALEKAIAAGSLEDLVADSAFVTKLKCCVGGTTHGMAFITQAKYNELYNSGAVKANTLYFIIDDTTAETLNDELSELAAIVDGLTKKLEESPRRDIENIEVCVYQDGEEKPYDFVSKLQAGKDADNIIGVAGHVRFITDLGISYGAHFSTLWNYPNEEKALVSVADADTIKTFFVEVSNGRNISVNPQTVYVISTGVKPVISSIYLDDLIIYCK